jgi:Fe2+ transport system protein B
VRSLPSTRSYLEILWDQLDDFLYRMLLIFATISIFLSFFSEEPYKWIAGVSIFFAVGLAVAISSLCDYAKESQFKRL